MDTKLCIDQPSYQKRAVFFQTLLVPPIQKGQQSDLAFQIYYGLPWLDTYATRGLQEITLYQNRILPGPWFFQGRFYKKLEKRKEELVHLQVRVQEDLQNKKATLSKVMTPHFELKTALFPAFHDITVSDAQKQTETPGVMRFQTHNQKQDARGMAVTTQDTISLKNQKARTIWNKLIGLIKGISFIGVIGCVAWIGWFGLGPLSLIVSVITVVFFTMTWVVPALYAVWKRLRGNVDLLKQKIQNGHQNWHQLCDNFKTDWLENIGTVQGFQASFYQSVYQALKTDYVIHLNDLKRRKPFWQFWRRREKAWLESQKQWLKAQWTMMEAAWLAFVPQLLTVVNQALDHLIYEKQQYRLCMDKHTLQEVWLLIQSFPKPHRTLFETRYQEIAGLDNKLFELLSKTIVQKKTIKLNAFFPWQTGILDLSPEKWRLYVSLLSDTHEKTQEAEKLLTFLTSDSRYSLKMGALSTLFLNHPEARKCIGNLLWQTFQGDYASLAYLDETHKTAVKQYYEKTDRTALKEASAALERGDLAPFMTLVNQYEAQYYPKKSIQEPFRHIQALKQLEGVYGVFFQGWTEAQYVAHSQQDFKQTLKSALLKASIAGTQEDAIRLLLDKDFWQDDYPSLREEMLQNRIHRVLASYQTSQPHPFTSFEKNLIVETNLYKIKQNPAQHWFFDLFKQSFKKGKIPTKNLTLLRKEVPTIGADTSRVMKILSG